MPTRLRAIAIAFVAFPLIAVAAGCGDDSDETSSTGTTVESTTTAADVETTTTAAATTTTAPKATTTTAASGTAFAAGSPEAAAADAYETVFDSAASFEQKAPHIEDADSLEPILAQYATVGNQFNDFTLDVKTVAITGTSAAVTYDLYFGGSKRYPDLPGTIEDRGGTWTVTRDELCSFTASAGVNCP